VKINLEITEAARRQLAMTVAVTAWFTAFILTLLDISQAIPNIQGMAPLVIFLVGVACAATFSLVITRLWDRTITGVFRAGMNARELSDSEPPKPPLEPEPDPMQP
jgi:hypothetical protein